MEQFSFEDRVVSEADIFKPIKITGISNALQFYRQV